ncbi:MAG: pilus assembly protein [Pseudomonadota bacterium]|nr:pilus assembly protein [Pseudomonadota bacterium]MDE3038603.1 pilus assembly protein [Pseudomonadota bacterium]
MLIRHVYENARRLGRDCLGAATVEFAIVATTVIIIVPLIWDLASVISSSMSLSGAMRAGIQYALSQPSDNAGIAQVIQTASGFPANSVTVTTAQSCTCSGSSATCGRSCSDGGNPAMYDTVTANYSVPTMLPYANYPNNSFSISKTVTVRVQ